MKPLSALKYKGRIVYSTSWFSCAFIYNAPILIRPNCIDFWILFLGLGLIREHVFPLINAGYEGNAAVPQPFCWSLWTLFFAHKSKKQNPAQDRRWKSIAWSLHLLYVLHGQRIDSTTSKQTWRREILHLWIGEKYNATGLGLVWVSAICCVPYVDLSHICKLFVSSAFLLSLAGQPIGKIWVNIFHTKKCKTVA